MRTLFLLLFSFLLASAETSPPEALKTAKSDLAAALASLAETRATIAAEKPQISAEFLELEQELLEARRLVRIARQSTQDRAAQLRQLESNAATLRQESTYLDGLLKDHALKLTTRPVPGSPPLEVAPELIAAEATNAAESLSSRLEILPASITRMEKTVGGSTSPGTAISSSGNVLEGTFAALGPASYFLSEDGQVGGDVLPPPPEGPPAFVASSAEPIAALTQGTETQLPLDPTGGNARAMDEIRSGPLDLVRKGGLWIWPIIFLAALSLIFGILKFLSFAKFREPSESWVSQILTKLASGHETEAIDTAAHPSHPAAAVLKNLIPASKISPDLAEETLYEQLLSVQSRVGTYLPIIAITAATAPLLGLLGTVSGMISTFNLITLFGSGDPKPLASGISEALITTLFGLVVAIPALVLHAFLSRRAQGIVQTTERLGLAFINGLKAETR